MTKPRFAAVLPTTSFELTRMFAERAEAGGFALAARPLIGERTAAPLRFPDVG